MLYAGHATHSLPPNATNGSASPIPNAVSPTLSVFPYPSFPFSPFPQHLTPFPTTTHAEVRPHASSETLSPVPSWTYPRALVKSGLSMSISVPVPVIPSAELPQHNTPPSEPKSAHEYSSPADTAVAAGRAGAKETAGKSSPMSAPLPTFWAVLPLPSCRALFLPQHLTSPLSSTAHVCLNPHAMAVAVRPVPRSTACSASPMSRLELPISCTLSPSPSWPSLLRPKHLTLPLDTSTQECTCPQHTASTAPSEPKFTVGTSAIGLLACPRASSSPYPVRPRAPLPQHLSVESARCAQAWWRPVAIDTAKAPRLTALKLLGSSSSPSGSSWSDPSFPLTLSPQHFTEPSDSKAQVKSSPQETSTTDDADPETSTAARSLPISPGSSPRGVVSPRPSSP